jgi:hypothetical protein
MNLLKEMPEDPTEEDEYEVSSYNDNVITIKYGLIGELCRIFENNLQDKELIIIIGSKAPSIQSMIKCFVQYKKTNDIIDKIVVTEYKKITKIKSKMMVEDYLRDPVSNGNNRNVKNIIEYNNKN